MKTRLIPLILALLFALNVSGQTTDSVELAYGEYFKLPREALFIHLNKTTYISGEDIWFKGYAYDRKNSLTSKGTSNVYVGIYDASGKQIRKKLCLASNGNTSGHFLIDSTFTAGDYYIKASTSWMRNFKEEDAFVQKIKIIDANYEDTQNVISSFDLQFLPEGGHIVADTKNIIGFKITNNLGKGVPISGVIYDNENNEVSTFKSNRLGLGKFLLQPKPNMNYKAIVTLKNGDTLTQNLPLIEQKGISIIVNNNASDKVIISLNTNTSTLPNIGNKNYKLLIHKDGKLKKVQFSFDGQTEKLLAIQKDELFFGINTITLFDSNNQPILERMFFNDLKLESKKISVSQLNKTNDSIVFSLYQSDATRLNLSISVLPETTTSYNPSHNILSAFYLKPYVKGAIEAPQYYFTKMDRRKKFELDVLLITQGWSRYQWNSIFNNPPKMQFNFENGITLKGALNNNKKRQVDSLYLYATNYYTSQFIPLDADNMFTINNFYLTDDEVLKFSSVNKNSQFEKPNLYISFEVYNTEDAVNSKSIQENNLENTNILTNSKNAFSKTIALEEVAIVAKRKKEKIETFDLSFRNNTTVINEKEGLTYPSVTDYIRTHGYNVSTSFGKVNINSRIPLSLGFGTGDKERYPSPSIYIDDVLLQDFNILYELSTAKIKKITVDKAGLGQGLNNGAAGVIRIYMKESSVFDVEEVNSNTTFQMVKPSIGFAVPKTFYTPKYSSYENRTFKDYGVISWHPQLNISQNFSTTIKVIDTKAEQVSFFIEGIADDGSLISEIKTLIIR